VGGEDPREADEMHPRLRNEGAEPGDELDRLEHDGARAIAPRPLHRVAKAAVAYALEALGGERGSGEVSAELKERLSVAPIDDALGVNAKAIDLRDERVVLGLVGTGGVDEAQGGLTGSRPESGAALHRGGMHLGEHRLVLSERVIGLGLIAQVTLHGASDPLGDEGELHRTWFR
jgi:hypothetical protein